MTGAEVGGMKSEQRRQLNGEPARRAGEEDPARAGCDVSRIGKILRDEAQREARVGESVGRGRVCARIGGSDGHVVAGGETVADIDDAARQNKPAEEAIAK